MMGNDRHEYDWLNLIDEKYVFVLVKGLVMFVWFDINADKIKMF